MDCGVLISLFVSDRHSSVLCGPFLFSFVFVFYFSFRVFLYFAFLMSLTVSSQFLSDFLCVFFRFNGFLSILRSLPSIEYGE